MLARKRMSARELADLLGERRMWVQYRLAETTPLQLNDLQRIADALEVGIADLLPQEVSRKSSGRSLTRADHQPDVIRTAESRVGRGTPTLTDPPILTPISRTSRQPVTAAQVRRPSRLSRPPAGGGDR